MPLEGALELSRALDTVCAMTRSVQDCITVDAVLSGAMLPVRRRPIAGMRLAVPQTMVLDGLDNTVAQAFDRSLSILSEAGAQIIEIPMKEFADIPKVNAPGGLSPIEAYAVHHERLARAQAQFDQRVAARIIVLPTGQAVEVETVAGVCEIIRKAAVLMGGMAADWMGVGSV